MADVLDDLAAFVSEKRQQSASAAEDEWRQRIEAKLDKIQGASPELSQREMLERLASDDAFMAELEAELAAEGEALEADEDPDEDPDEDSDEDSGGDEAEEEAEADGIRWRREPLRVPRIYSGEDEPDEIAYLDEEGREQVRRGRKRGQPVSEEWVEVEAEADDDEPGEPGGEED